MKKRFEKMISIALAASAAFSVFSVSIPVKAAEEPEKFIYVEDGGVGEYGYVSYRLIDENGNEVEEAESLSTQGISTFGLRRSAVLPSAYDSRDIGCVTEAKDQGRTGNCWAFAATSLMESESILKGIDTLETADYSEAHFAWFTDMERTENESDPTYGDGTNSESPYMTGGNWRMASASLARWTGMANEADFPYYGYSVSSMGGYNESERYNTNGGAVLESAVQLTTVEEVKQWIIDHGSVCATYYHNDSFYSFDNAAYYVSENYTTNHEITIIGWDDSYPASNFKTEPESDGAWICKNSWGENWGDGGFFRISYCDATLNDFAGFTAMAADDYYKNYTYNGSAWKSAYGKMNSTQIANVFTASGYEKLAAVSTVTVDADTIVKATVYKGLPDDYTTPVEGTQAAYIETVLGNEGYHTIYLENEVSLEPGEIFSVVLELWNDCGTIFVPVEKGDSFSSKSGESFVNMNAAKQNWTDAKEMGMCNLYIQAITKCDHQMMTEKTESTCSHAGSEKTCCSQCGMVESERLLPLKEHTYGEWSEYSRTSSDKETAVRTCNVCGASQTRTYSTGNVIDLRDFLQIFFARFMEMFKTMLR